MVSRDLPRRCLARALMLGATHRRDLPVLKLPDLESAPMGMVSLISALIGAQTGEMQLAVAARLARTGNPDSGASIAQLTAAADGGVNSLANVAENIGTNLDISA